jgi:ABC-type branched-subunit amino acid transport system permease subunit
MTLIRESWTGIPFWQRRLLVSAFLIFDAYLGMIYNAGVIGWTGLINNDLKWLVLALEMMAGGLVLVNTFLNLARARWPAASLISTPLLVALFGLVILEIALSGLGRSATMNFNVAAIGLGGLYWAAAYLSIAIGLTLTYKVQRYANFAQAEMMLIGAYVALTLMWTDRFFPISDAPKDGVLNWELLIWAGIFAFAITGLAGLFIDRLVYKRLRSRLATPQVMMITSLGVAMVLRALLFMRFSAGTHRFVPDRDWRLATSSFEMPTERIQLHLGDRVNAPLMELANKVSPYAFTYTKIALIVGVFGSVIVLLLLLHRTRLGRQMRAVADNPDLAASSGIHVERVHGTSAFLSAGLTGLGGALLAAILPVNPELGLSLLLPAFAVVVLGTIGSVPGVIIGAIIVGLLRSVSEPILIGAGGALDRPTAAGFAEVMPFVFLVGLLLLAPRGIGHALQNWNIERIRKRRIANLEDDLPVTHDIPDSLLGMPDLEPHEPPVMERIAERKDRLFETVETLISSAWAVPVYIVGQLLASVHPARAAAIRFFPGWRLHPGRLIRIDRETERGSWVAFGIFFLILIVVVWLLPSVSTLTKTLQVARVMTLVGIFGLMAFSLNLHTGITGMTNFGVIFFVGIGAVTVGLLAAPVETNGYGWSPLAATAVAVLLSAVAGWLLAYPTARLRMDYFAIVTISLGEMLRISLQAEPLLRAGTVTSAIGISQYSRPFESWWSSGPSDFVGSILGLPNGAPYVVLLGILSVAALLAIWFVLNTLLASPWGRILRSIREDEEVSKHHGHNILTHKAASLAVGAAVAGLAGALWAWLNASIFPDFMNPVRSTFLVWAAFIVGGRGNNRGMIVGAFLIVIVEFVFNVMVVARGNSSLAFHDLTTYMDSVFSWLVIDVGGLIWSARSISEAFPRGDVTVALSHLKLALIGSVIVAALLLSPKGLLPEVPTRPKRPSPAPETDRTPDEYDSDEVL